MAKKKLQGVSKPPADAARPKLPPGVTLMRTLRGHTDWIGRIAWSPDGRMLASPSGDKTIRLWDAETGECLRTVDGHTISVESVAFDSVGSILASSSQDNTVKLWNVASGQLLRTLEGHKDAVWSVAFDVHSGTLAGASSDGSVRLWHPASGRLIKTFTEPYDQFMSVAFDPHGGNLAAATYSRHDVKLWKVTDGRLLHTFEGHDASVQDFAFDPTGGKLASGSADQTVKLWNTTSGTLMHTLEGPTGSVLSVDFDFDGHLLAAQCADDSVRIWRSDSWELVAIIVEPIRQGYFPGLSFHPRLPRLATVGSDPETSKDDRSRVIHIWELDLDVLFGQPAAPTVNYISAKVVLVGDSGVGKTGLGWRLAHGEFKEHASTHGQQFWLLKQLSMTRSKDGAQCEAILWDLAGQDDYRLIHALFIDDADLALVLFDPTRNDDPLHGVEFWLKQLKAGTSAAGGTKAVLVAARSDRGTPRLTQEELEAFCKQRGLAAYHCTSALKDEGIADLVRRMAMADPVG